MDDKAMNHETVIFNKFQNIFTTRFIRSRRARSLLFSKILILNASELAFRLFRSSRRACCCFIFRVFFFDLQLFNLLTGEIWWCSPQPPPSLETFNKLIICLSHNLHRLLSPQPPSLSSNIWRAFDRANLSPPVAPTSLMICLWQQTTRAAANWKEIGKL